MENTILFETTTAGSALWPAFLDCLHDIAPEQATFVLGDYSKNLPCNLIVAVDGDLVVGFLRFGIQEIGPEFGCTPLELGDGFRPTEAKIHAFAVRPEYRRQGIGSTLQRRAIDVSRQLGCHQLTSHTSLDNIPNLSLKLALGFAAQPGPDGSVLLFMPLRGWQSKTKKRFAGYRQTSFRSS